MSRRTRPVAVAVKACRLTPGNRSRSRAELPVFRPEVVAPLADAVGLVDGDELHRRGSRAERQEHVGALADQPSGET